MKRANGGRENDMKNSRQNALTKVIESISRTSARATIYSTALLGIAATFPNVPLPPSLAVIAGGLGIEAMGSILDKVAFDNELSDEQIISLIENTLEKSNIDQYLSKDEFWHGFSHLRKSQVQLKSQNGMILDVLNRLEAIYSKSQPSNDWMKEEISWLERNHPKSDTQRERIKKLDELSLYETARTLTKNREYNEATIYWLELGNRFPDNVEYEDYLRLCISKVKREVEIERAVRALIAQAQSAMHAEEYDDALHHINQAIYLHPNSERAKELKNVILERRKELTRMELQELFVRVQSALKSSDYEDALQCTERALMLDPMREDFIELRVEAIKLKKSLE